MQETKWIFERVREFFFEHGCIYDFAFPIYDAFITRFLVTVGQLGYEISVFGYARWFTTRIKNRYINSDVTSADSCFL